MGSKADTILVYQNDLENESVIYNSQKPVTFQEPEPRLAQRQKPNGEGSGSGSSPPRERKKNNNKKFPASRWHPCGAHSDRTGSTGVNLFASVSFLFFFFLFWTSQIDSPKLSLPGEKKKRSREEKRKLNYSIPSCMVTSTWMQI